MTTAAARLYVVTDLINFPIIWAICRWATSPAEGGTLYSAGDRGMPLLIIESPKDQSFSPHDVPADAIMELVLEEFETEDARLRTGSGQIGVSGSLVLPRHALDELKRLHQEHHKWLLRQWYFAFDVPQITFPAPRTIQPSSAIPDRWVKRIKVDEIAVTLLEWDIDPTSLTPMRFLERKRHLENTHFGHKTIGSWVLKK